MDNLLEIISIIMSSLTMIIVAIINYRATIDHKRQEEREKKEDERVKLREKKDLLQMRMLDANTQLTIVAVNALTGGKNNGNVEAARIAVEEAQADYNRFLQEVAAHETAK